METKMQENPSIPSSGVPYFQSVPGSVVQLSDTNPSTIILQTEQPTQTVFVKTLTLPLLHVVQPPSFPPNQQLQSDRSNLGLSSGSSVIVTPLLHSESIGHTQTLTQKQGGQTVTLNIVGTLPVVPETGLNANGVVTAHSKSTNAGKYTCKHCGRDCQKPSVLQKHIRSHTGERPFPCTTCNIAFKTQSNLYKHRRTQTHVNNARLSSESENSSVLDESETLLSEQQDAAGIGKEKDNSKTCPLIPGSEKNLQEIWQTCTLPRDEDQELASKDGELHTENTYLIQKNPGSPNICPASALPPIISPKKVTEEQKTPSTNKHIQLQRQQATYSGKQWHHKSSDSSPRKCESTDSGYLSHSDSAEQQPWCSSPFQSLQGHSSESEPEKTPSLRSSSSAFSKVESEFSGKRTTISAEKKKLEEHISKLISDNKAVVDDKQLENVRPRKTILSKQGSIDLPMPYTYKDSFHFDIKTLDPSRKVNPSLSLTKSTSQITEKSKAVFYSVPTQFSSNMESSSIRRSNSVSFNERHNIVQGKINSSAHPFHSIPSHCMSPTSTITSLTTKSVDIHASHHRGLVRQIAIDDLLTSNNGGGVSQPDGSISSGASETNVPNTKCRNVTVKYSQRKQKMFSQDKWLMYGNESFKKIYQKMKNSETAKKLKHKIMKDSDSVSLPSQTYEKIEDKCDSLSTSEELKTTVTCSCDCLPVVMTPLHFPLSNSKKQNISNERTSQSPPSQNSNGISAETSIPSLQPAISKKEFEDRAVIVVSSKSNASAILTETDSEEKGERFHSNNKTLKLQPQLSASSVTVSRIQSGHPSQVKANLPHPRLVRQPNILILEPTVTQNNKFQNDLAAQSVMQLQNQGSMTAPLASEELSERKKLKVEENKQLTKRLPQASSTLEFNVLSHYPSSNSEDYFDETDPHKQTNHFNEEDMKKIHASYDSGELTQFTEKSEQVNTVEKIVVKETKCNQSLNALIPESNMSATLGYSAIKGHAIHKNKNNLLKCNESDSHKISQSYKVQENKPNHLSADSSTTIVKHFIKASNSQVLHKEVMCARGQAWETYATPNTQHNAFAPKYQLKLPDKKCSVKDRQINSHLEQSALMPENSGIQTSTTATAHVFENSVSSCQSQAWIQETGRDNEGNFKTGAQFKPEQKARECSSCFIADVGSHLTSTCVAYRGKFSISSIISCPSQNLRCTPIFPVNSPFEESLSSFNKGHTDYINQETILCPSHHLKRNSSNQETTFCPSHHLKRNSSEFCPFFQGASQPVQGSQYHLDTFSGEHLCQFKCVSDSIIVTCTDSTTCHPETFKSCMDSATKVPSPPSSDFEPLRSFYSQTGVKLGAESVTSNSRSHSVTLQPLSASCATTTKVCFACTNGEPSLTWCCLKRSLPLPTEQKETKNSAYFSLHTFSERVSETIMPSQYEIAFTGLRKTSESTACTITTTAGLKTMDSSITWTADREKVARKALVKGDTKSNSYQTEDVPSVSSDRRKNWTKYTQSHICHSKYVKTTSKRYKPHEVQMKTKRMCRDRIKNKMLCPMKRSCQMQKCVSTKRCKCCDFAAQSKGKMLRHVKVQEHRKKFKADRRRMFEDKALNENDGEKACRLNKRAAVVPIKRHLEEFRKSKEFHSVETMGDHANNCSLQELCLFPTTSHAELQFTTQVEMSIETCLQPISLASPDTNQVMESVQNEMNPLMMTVAGLEPKVPAHTSETCTKGKSVNVLNLLLSQPADEKHVPQKVNIRSLLQGRQSPLFTSEQSSVHHVSENDYINDGMQAKEKNNRACQKTANTAEKNYEPSLISYQNQESTYSESVICSHVSVESSKRRRSLGMTGRQIHLEYSDISSDDDEGRLIIEIEPHEPNTATQE